MASIAIPIILLEKEFLEADATRRAMKYSRLIVDQFIYELKMNNV